MKSFCVYTPSARKSNELSLRTLNTAKKFGIEITRVESVNPSNLEERVRQEGLFLKYTPVKTMKTDFKEKTAPIGRICNGVTHYMLYRKCVEMDEPILIVEHDAYFVGTPPSEGIYDGVIQISSHTNYQMNAEKMKNCVRAQKMRIHSSHEYDSSWDQNTGVIRHPLTGTNGTSGYIIGPDAALKMMNYIKNDGVAFADRIRTEHIGTNNLYLQYPFSVFCSDNLKEITC